MSHLRETGTPFCFSSQCLGPPESPHLDLARTSGLFNRDSSPSSDPGA
jgi:hypothetical protein